MPNLPMHIYLAEQVSQQLDLGYVHDHMGSCLLGSTAPDIRAMAKWDRQRTHFAPISVDQVGTGTKEMFAQHPRLADHRSQTPETRAFILGYVCHLAADELWITTMFRPHFQEGSQGISNQLEGQIWDRALQLDMDRSVIEEDFFELDPDMLISGSDKSVLIEFLEDELLYEWRDWVLKFLGWDFSWDRLKRALNRMHRDDEGVQMIVDSFLANMPESLEKIYHVVPRSMIESYKERVVVETLSQVREYLSGT